MDVFKLLSRSSKSGAKASVQNLPSNGAAANPQLFGHDGPEFHGVKNKKRKRGQDKTEAVEEDASLFAGLDFFGAVKKPDGEGERKRKRKAAKDADAEESSDEREDTAADAEAQTAPEQDAYDAAESKRLGDELMKSP